MNEVGAALERILQENFDIPPLASEIIVAATIFFVAVIVGWAVFYVFKRYFMKWAEKTKTKLDDEILKNIKAPVALFIILVGLYYSLGSLSFLEPYSEAVSELFNVAEILLVTFVIIRVVNILISWYGEKGKERKRPVSEHLLFVLKKIIQAFILLFAFLAILSAMGVDLSTVVVGLGVGGIAIALALQNILSDVFSAFSIYFDRPFEIGDFVIIGDYAGTVRKIGIKSTRIELLQGEELVMSNRELTTASVRNFKKMRKRRISFSIGVTYDTSLEKLKKIPEMIKDIIDPNKLPDVDRLDRVHFKEFGPYSLNFEIVYYMKTRDYLKYMDTQQAINFAIKEAFEKEGIEMAFPTQTIFLNQ